MENNKMAEARGYIEKLLTKVIKSSFTLEKDSKNGDDWFMYEFEYPCDDLIGFRNVGAKCAISVNRTEDYLHAEYFVTIPKADLCTVSLNKINTFNRENLLQLVMLFENDDNYINGIRIRQFFPLLTDAVDVSVKFVLFAKSVFITYSKEILSAVGVDEDSLTGKA